MNIKTLLRKEAPAILVGLGVAGFITATVMSAKATHKAHDKIEDIKEAEPVQKIKTAASIYAPTVGMIMISTGCILAGTRLQRYRYGALMALYAVGEKNLSRLQTAILNEVGEKKAESIREKVVEPPNELIENTDASENELLFYDVYTGRVFKADSIETVRQAVNTINELAIGEDFATLNELYFELGLPPTEFGDEIGWSSSELLRVSFDSFLQNNKPVVSISFDIHPRNYNVF